MSELSTSTLHFLVERSHHLRLVNITALDWKDGSVQLHGLEEVIFERLVHLCQDKGIRLEDRCGLTAEEVRGGQP
jgi:hypothetical protein